MDNNLLLIRFETNNIFEINNEKQEYVVNDEGKSNHSINDILLKIDEVIDPIRLKIEKLKNDKVISRNTDLIITNDYAGDLVHEIIDVSQNVIILISMILNIPMVDVLNPGHKIYISKELECTRCLQKIGNCERCIFAEEFYTNSKENIYTK